MSTVQTVTGPVPADQLGLTLIHEHFFSADEAVSAQWPHLRDPEHDYELALQSARAVLERGVRTVVDPTAMMIGRDVRALERLSRQSGLQIVTCTGIYTYDHLPRFLSTRGEDFIASLFVHDIEQGVQGTGIKAAFIKCAADRKGMTRGVEIVHRAAARASLRTGAPVMGHSRPASGTGPRQVEVLMEEGLAPEKIQIAHTGDTDDLEYIESLLASGVYVGLDRYGLDQFLPTERRNATALALLERGHAERLFLSQDFSVPIAAGLDWYPPRVMEASRASGATADWSMTFVLDRVVPLLRQSGMSEEQLHTVMVENPARWLGATAATG